MPVVFDSANLFGAGNMNAVLIQNSTPPTKRLAVANLTGHGICSLTSRMRADLSGNGEVTIASPMISAYLTGVGAYNGIIHYPPVLTPLDTDTIQASEEYNVDLSMLVGILFRSIATEELLCEENVFLQIMALALALQRYYIRNLQDQVDIDQTSYLDQIQDEVGEGLPKVEVIPIVEFIRENKSWYTHKTTLPLYQFIGDLIGSEIEIDFPAELILVTDLPRTCLSGAVTAHGGKLPFAESKLGRLRDGIFWARFDYVLTVQQAQNVQNYQDFYNLVEAIHPAGMKQWINLNYNFLSDSAAVIPNPVILEDELIHDAFLPSSRFPTLDNGFLLDNRNSPLSMHGGQLKLNFLSITEIPILELDTIFQRMSTDSLLHKYIANVGLWAGFSRYVGDGYVLEASANLVGEAFFVTEFPLVSNLTAHLIGHGEILSTSSYREVFSDNDPIVYENVTTNVGISQYLYGDIKDLTFREIKDAAYNLDQANMRGMFEQQGLDVVLVELLSGFTFTILVGRGRITNAHLTLLIARSANLTGNGTISSANLEGEKDLVASITGATTITNANLRLRTFIDATLTGNSTLDGDLTGTLSMAQLNGNGALFASLTSQAFLTGSGDVSPLPELEGIFALSSSMTGSGDITEAVLQEIPLIASLSGNGSIFPTLLGHGAIYSFGAITGNGGVLAPIFYSNEIFAGHGSLMASPRMSAALTGSGALTGQFIKLTARLTGQGFLIQYPSFAPKHQLTGFGSLTAQTTALTANLIGNGTVSNADRSALFMASGNLLGNGEVLASPRMYVVLVGSGDITDANLT